MADATIPDSHRDLVEAPTTVVFTTLNADGTPQSTAVWSMLADDGTVKVSFKTSGRKFPNLTRHPWATLFYLDRENAWRTLELRCRVELAPDDDERTMTKRIIESYGADPAAFGDTVAADRRIATCIPIRAVTMG